MVCVAQSTHAVTRREEKPDFRVAEVNPNIMFERLFYKGVFVRAQRVGNATERKSPLTSCRQL